MVTRGVVCPCGTEFTWQGKRGKAATYCPACQADRQRDKVRRAMQVRRAQYEKVVGTERDVQCADCDASFTWVVHSGVPPTRCAPCKRKARQAHKKKYLSTNPNARRVERAGQKRRYQANRELIQLKSRARRYGVSVEWITENEARGCSICRSKTPGGRGWSIDHDHVTGAVRGILCNGCNSGIGHLQDDPDVIFRAYKYVKQHRQMKMTM